MGYEKNKAHNLMSLIEARKLGLALLAGCCVVIFTYFISMSDTTVCFLSAGNRQPYASYTVREDAVAETQIIQQTLGKETEDLSETNANAPADDETVGDQKREEPICDVVNPRSEFCDIVGDVRVQGGGNSSAVTLVSPRRGESRWQVLPYVRKHMRNIARVSVLATADPLAAPRCTSVRNVPAIVFALGGFTGNYYHDFTDLLLPIFLTAREFDGEVQFLVTNIQPWWLLKYRPLFRRLTRYDIVDLDGAAGAGQVFCHPRVMVGLRFHDDLVIDPPRAPRGLAMRDFTGFLRDAYGLPRGRAERAPRPRLLLVARNRTRRFVNLPEIAAAAERVGFEVVRGDAKFGDVAAFAGVVNSCDVMVGVHGAGLTNFLFLPERAVLVQVVPCCGLEVMAAHTFKRPAEDAGVRYLEYSIAVEESTLLEEYPREHPVFTEPESVHRRGFYEMAEIYLGKQNVRLDVDRFRPVFLRAMALLHDQ
ncbi:alpha-1,3-arabinosyltransferase XAT2-like isoform X2 [Zingiber officinale]|uniref:alpha-1,3-arabinosyltransferase XAT2-like isoform X2 n=1 Tax=Zingiber officinale TaxID=94328 RepID=UPI001C4BCE0C|nr:alpha-1,3-arabinosyltransferase XAT2-like isoform X2 [Zingiber officinale]